MRVAHILRKYNPAEWGGTETAVKQLLDGLKAADVTGVVFAPRLSTCPAHDPIAAAGHPLKRYRATVPVWNITPEQRQQLISIGGNLWSFHLVSQLLRERGLSLIHTHALNRIGGIGLTIARARRIPFVATVHGGVMDLPKNLQQMLAAPLEGGFEWGKFFGAAVRSRHVLSSADAIVTCNPREAALLQEKYPAKQIIVQPHGISLQKFALDFRAEPLAAYPQLAEKRVLLVLGRIDPAKNQGWVLVQFPEILRRYPDAHLVLAGACTDELYGKALRKEVRKLGLEDKVLFTGGLAPDDPKLIGLMQLASCMIVPSISETFGLVIIEAWGAGTPVISSRTSGALSIVKHGENGLLFSIESIPEFHACLDEMLGSKERAASMARNGHQVAAREFDATVLARRIKSLYQSLIEQKRK
jgi:starch synthase